MFDLMLKKNFTGATRLSMVQAKITSERVCIERSFYSCMYVLDNQCTSEAANKHKFSLHDSMPIRE